MRIFVTGATGFLGYHFVLKALALGHEIMCLRRSTSVNKFTDDINEKIFWVEEDEDLKKKVESFKPNILMHAAWGGVRDKGRDLRKVQEGNLVMSKKIFQLFPYDQIISIGSQAEYGYYEHVVSEDDPVLPNTEYGRAKDECRKWLQNYCTEGSIEWQWIRIFSVFGEKQTGGLINIFGNACRSNQKEFLTTEGLQKYSYLYCTDFADALCNVLGQSGKSGVYNLSQAKDIYSNKELLEKIKEFYKSDIRIVYGAVPYPPNQVMLMDGVVDKFEENFGKIPHTDFDNNLKATLLDI